MAEEAQRFPSMEIREADGQCGKPRRLHHRSCPACKARIVLHCGECLIQVTGCMCTMVERHGQDGALAILREKMDEQEARRRLSAAGLWTPN